VIILNDLDFLKSIVEIYSVSENEMAVTDHIVEVMKKLGFNSYKDEVGNAVGEIGEGDNQILLVGHIDTVPGEIPVKIRGGKLYGRGSVDAKGPFATFVMAASKVKNLKNKKIVVVGAVEEEIASSKGAKNLLNKHKPEFIIIGEPSGYDAITIGYKGATRVEYQLDKENFHTAGEGENEIEEAINFFLKLKGLVYNYNQDKTKIFDKLQIQLSKVNSISDGFTNTIHMDLRFRIPIGYDISNIKKFIETNKGNAQIKIHGIEYPIKVPKNNDLVKQFLKSMRKHHIKPRFKVKTGTSDMNVLGYGYPDVPIVTYGPGDSSLDHTPNEHIIIKDYSKAIEVLTEVLENL
jgi:[amino group carrier protein]-lysine/ornithine hydrolase